MKPLSTIAPLGIAAALCAGARANSIDPDAFGLTRNRAGRRSKRRLNHLSKGESHA